MSDRRQWHIVTGGLQEDWKSTSAGDLGVSSADRRRTAADRQVLRCSAMKSSVDDDRQFKLDSLGCWKPLKTASASVIFSERRRPATDRAAALRTDLKFLKVTRSHVLYCEKLVLSRKLIKLVTELQRNAGTTSHVAYLMVSTQWPWPNFKVIHLRKTF